MSNDQPLEIRARHAERLVRRMTALERISLRYAWARVLVFVGGVAASVTALFALGVWPFWLTVMLALVLFGLVVYRHRRVETLLSRLDRLRQIVHTEMARIRRNWAALPPARQREPRYEHPFEGDLDLVGERGLHRLLDTTSSTQASARLHTWLSDRTPNPAQIAQRQALVRELTVRRLLRHKVQINGLGLVAAEGPWDAEQLLGWLRRHPPVAQVRRWAIGLSGLGLLNALLFLGDQTGVIATFWPFTLALYGLLYSRLTPQVAGVFHEAAALQAVIERLMTLFAGLETFGYARAPHLRALCTLFLTGAQRPSQLLRRLRWIVAAAGIQGNPFIALVLNVVLPWGVLMAAVLDGYKATIAGLAPRWLEVWHELETVGALATFADLNPHYPFPVLRDAEAPCFSVTGLGHPLLPEAGKVRNDFTFTGLGQVTILTGSNMAGKSTFLKALGVNLALAYAGSVVDAAGLMSVYFRLFTCIKVSDSLTSGVSYFYAEVQRLRALLTALEADDPQPLFFGIDEIFRGTNNRERLIGSRAYIHALINRRGVGLIATHDLELVKLADQAAQVSNYHFRDDIQDDQMVFDYRLRPGPSPTTNALKIMARAGLPVDGFGEGS
jgi:hypothetical protein